MKSFIFLFLLVSPIFTENDNKLEKLFNVDENPHCRGDCKTLKKVLSVFPLTGDEQTTDSDLNFFNWKYFYVFNDHLSVYRADQSEPVRGTPTGPIESDFLNNFPIDFVQTPCNDYRDVCTVSQFRDQVYKPIKKEFAPNQKAMDAMGKDLWNNCIIYTQDLLQEPKDMNYVCAKNIEDLQAVLRISNNVINNYDSKEFVGRLYQINEKADDLIEMNVHINSELFVANNQNDCIADGSKNKNYQEFFSYRFMVDIVSPAFSLLKQNLQIPWKGDESKKPEIERCFTVPVLIKNGKEKINQYFCVFTNDNGSLKLSAQDSNLIVTEWITRVNKRIKSQKIKMAEEVLRNLDSKSDASLPELVTVKDEIYSLAVKVEHDCQEKVKAGLLNLRNCEEMKMRIIVEKSEELCARNKKCLSMIKKAIHDGDLPLKESGPNKAFSSDNPYKANIPNTPTPEATPGATGQSSIEGGLGAGAGEGLGSTGSGDGGKGVGSNEIGGKPIDDATAAADKGETLVTHDGKDKAVDIMKQELQKNEGNGSPAGAADAGEGKTGGTEGGAGGNNGGVGSNAEQDGNRIDGVLKVTGLTKEVILYAEIEKMKDEVSPIKTTQKTGQPAPSKLEIQKALNSFQRIFSGRKVDKIEGIETYCVSTQSNIARAIGILPFITKFDPWLEYLGNIRDLQMQKN